MWVLPAFHPFSSYICEKILAYPCQRECYHTISSSPAPSLPRDSSIALSQDITTPSKTWGVNLNGQFTNLFWQLLPKVHLRISQKYTLSVPVLCLHGESAVR